MPCLSIERDSMTARVSFQFHNTEVAAAEAAAAAMAAAVRCEVAAVYMSISLNRRIVTRRARSSSTL